MEISRFAVIFAVIFMAGCVGSDDADVCTDDATKLTKTEETALASNTFNYIRQVLLPPGIESELISIEPYDPMYIINFTFGGAGMPQTPAQVHVTSDGKLFIMNPQYCFIIDTKEIPETPEPGETAAPAEPTEQTRATVSIDDDYCLGSADAPVTIVEFSDYQCPYCQLFWAQTLPQIKSEYIDNDLVKFVYRDLPLDFHPNAQKAAEATECAGDEGKFWEMHYAVFGGLNEWSGSGDAAAVFEGYAAELELDEDAFAGCLDSGKYQEEVQRDYQEGATVIASVNSGRVSTPSFFVNGIFISGAADFSTFKQIIDAELAENGANSTITGNCTGK